MESIKIRFCPALDPLTRRGHQAIDDLIHPLSLRFLVSKHTWNPHVDIYENNEEVIVFGDIAGVNPQDIDIEISAKTMRISCKRLPMVSSDSGRYCLAEIQYGTFDRVIILPSPIDRDVVSASYSNGLLQIRMAKLQTGQP